MNNTNNPKINKSLFYALPVLSFIAVAVMGIILIQPKIAEIQTLLTDTSEEKEKSQLLEAKKVELDKLDQRKPELQAQLAALTVAVPNNKNVSELIISLQRIAESSEVQIQSIQLTPGKIESSDSAVAKADNEIPFTLSYAGSYESIQAFLGKVYRAKRLFNIDSVTINTGNSEEGNSALLATLAMIGYYQPIPSAPKDATEAVQTLSTEDNAVYQTLSEYTSYED